MAIEQLLKRPRRLRRTQALRDLIRETTLTPHDLILPLFIRPGRQQQIPIASMPGHAQLTLDYLPEKISEIVNLNIPGIILFGIPEQKDAIGSAAFQDNGIIQQAIRCIKDCAPNLLIIADVCCCEYTDHGHCGVLDQHHDVDNDKTLDLLAQQVVSLARAGCDMLAPSGMMDGMVKSIRQALDTENYSHLPILSYAIKYCSGFYGPFRDAAESSPKSGNRQTYQMDYANANEALKEAALDIEEGADMLMVKPALSYLDIIYRCKQRFPEYPLGAYQVSGEFAMIKAAAEKGWIDESRVMLETLTSIKRAGADFIINYFAKDVAQLLDP
ncbi:MAG: porphobilinogen synthase [Legionellales bacterium]|nr:porphobilinogen synthase [Legionellales bacterium]